MEFTREFFKDKKIGDIITKDTKILDEFGKGFDVREEVFKNPDRPQVHEDIAVVNNEYYVICFKDEKPIALFHVYELHGCTLNGPRGVVFASGHETNHEYWFDNGEYDVRYTR